MESEIDQIMGQLKATEFFDQGDITFSLPNMDVLVRQNGAALHIRARPNGHRRYAAVYTFDNGVHYFPMVEYTQEKVIVLLKELVLFLTLGATTKNMQTFLGLLGGKIKVGDVAPSLTPPSTTFLGRGLTPMDMSYLEGKEHLLPGYIGNDLFLKGVGDDGSGKITSEKGPTGFLRQGSSKRRPISTRPHVHQETQPPLPERELLKPRCEFADDQEYIVYLETLVGLPHPIKHRVPTHAVLKPCSTVNIEPDLGYNLDDPFADQMVNGHYIPKEDEPSPFIYQCNWVEWKRAQPGWVNYKGSYAPILEKLYSLLSNEKFRSLVDREKVPFNDRVICAGLPFPSLGMVIHVRYEFGLDWEEVHRLRQVKITNQHPR